MDALKEILFWLMLGAATAPVWGAFVWTMWADIVRPHLIPRREIERLAAELFSNYGDRAEDIAFAKEYGAWCHSDGFEQGKWRRVREQIGNLCRQRKIADASARRES